MRDQILLDGKVALVTGAGAGIGRGVAVELANRGATVIVSDVDKKMGVETVDMIAENHGQAVFSMMDVSNSREVQKRIRESVSKLGRLDFLVNNAGLAGEKYDPIWDLSEEAWHRTIDINLTGVFLCSKYAIREMIRNKDRVENGSIVNISSIMGLSAVPQNAPYCASKSGVVGLTKAMALDCAPLRIRVNCICPGSVTTPSMERVYRRQKNPKRARAIYNNGYPIGRIGSPSEIGNFVCFLVNLQSSFITGSILVADGGISAENCEGLLDRMIARGRL